MFRLGTHYVKNGQLTTDMMEEHQFATAADAVAHAKAILLEQPGVPADMFPACAGLNLESELFTQSLCRSFLVPLQSKKNSLSSHPKQPYQTSRHAICDFTPVIG